MAKMTVTARLVVDGADRAIELYRDALGAKLLSRFTGPDGKVVHAELRLGESVLTVKDEDAVDRAPTTLGGSPVLFTLDVDDADEVAAALQRAGASVVFPVTDVPYGFRQGRLQDPFGFQWMVSQRTEDLSDRQTQERLDAELG
jgi:uncharacterized glyoxalase superfamily protein PhnB